MKVVDIYVIFERAISGFVLIGMIIVIGLAAVEFAREIFVTLVEYRAGINYTTFQALFDRVLAAVIALELARSILQLVTGHHGLAQLRTVVTIGMLAVVRKLIVLEIETTSGMFLLGLAGAVAALGFTYIVIDRVDRHGGPPPGPTSSGER